MGLIDRDDGWRMPDWLWAKIAPLLPPPPAHPLGCHRPRIPDRRVMDAILLVLRTGMQWNALRITDICNEDGPRLAELHAKIGELTMENDFLSAALGRVSGPSAKR
jgi:hypothetical protein